ncbi:MAG: sel1 repeat family protein [Bacteroides sp.]|nr:sel1 repeat family protein [Bacteroides sp.]
MKRFFTLMILAVALTQGSLADTEYSKELEAKAQNGDAFAQAQLGYCYHAGAGTEQDYTKAFEWFKKSAENGNSYSMYYMGRSLLFGEGTEDDQYEAVKWFEKSYAHGYEKAKEMLRNTLFLNINTKNI